MTPATPKSRGAAPKSADAAATEFGERMRSARRTRGLTLREVSEGTGISITYLSDLERGALANPTLDKLVLIAKTLGVTIADLLGADEGAQPGGDEVPAALQELSATPQFQEAVASEAKRWRTTPAVVEREWISALQRIDVLGHRPRDFFDYLFVFEAIRRALEKP